MRKLRMWCSPQGHEFDHSPSLVPGLTMRGAAPLLPTCVHMVYTGTTLPLSFLRYLSLLFELWSVHGLERDRNPTIGSF